MKVMSKPPISATLVRSGRVFAIQNERNAMWHQSPANGSTASIALWRMPIATNRPISDTHRKTVRACLFVRCADNVSKHATDINSTATSATSDQMWGRSSHDTGEAAKARNMATAPATERLRKYPITIEAALIDVKFTQNQTVGASR